jgi:ADP-ribose pyrophosphatase YjhB (NUDIX family)
VPGEQPCAGGIVLDGAGRLLLVRRARPPSAGARSVPGGRCRPGEPPAAACVREVAEETGLAVTVLRWAGRVERPAPDGGVYVIDDFVCALAGGSLQAGDDAAEAAWFDLDELAGIDLVPGLLEALREWSVVGG